jgi:spermidine/putrescine transport system substrate-binding protein
LLPRDVDHPVLVCNGRAQHNAIAHQPKEVRAMRRRPLPPSMPALSRRRLFGCTLAVAATAPLLPRLAGAQEKIVNVYNWDTYIGEDTLEEFTDATGINVRYDLFASNDELFAKLREGNPGYDVIYPSNNYVQRMIAADMLERLDHAQIPNFKNVDPRFADPQFDPGRQHSMPYFWGTIGLGYRSSAAQPTKWADILASDRYKGRVSLLNDSDIVRVALKYLGYSLNSTDQGQIDEAAEVLTKAKPNIKAFAPDTGQDLLISGEVDVCMEWSGDIQQVMAEDDDLAYVVPEEGSIRWEDDMCVPKGAPNVANAHAFINYILEGKVHGAIASEVKYACPNAAAMEFIPEEDRDNPAIYPPPEVLAKCEPAVYQGEQVASLYEAALTRVLAA